MAYVDFKKLKARVSITDILNHYSLLDDLKETTQGFAGECPFCGSNALKVNIEKNAWYCFGECKTNARDGVRYGGNILDFVVRKEDIVVSAGKESAAAKKAAVLIAGWFPPEEEPQGSKKPDDEAKAEKQPEAAAREVAEKAQEGTPAKTQEDDEKKGEGGEPHHPVDETVIATREPDLTGLANKPLDFTLKSIDVEHPVLDSLGLGRETLKAFDVGYFTGKGVMHDKVVLPFHSIEGLLVAYAGYSTKDGAIRYPKQFDRRLELYNVFRAEIEGIRDDGLVLVTDLLNVLRLYELGVRRVVALPTSTLYSPQIERIRDLVGIGGQVDFVPWTKEYRDNLRVLSEHFHVRLHRYYEGSEDEFLGQVASSLRW